MKIFFFSFLLIFSVTSHAQLHPAPNAVLNYTQVLFTIPNTVAANNYVITITNSEAKTFTYKTNTLACLVSNNLHFGHAYTWQYKGYYNKKLVYTSSLIPFAIGTHNSINPASFTYKITVHNVAAASQPHTIFLCDAQSVAINYKGKPVWYMPPMPIAYPPQDSNRRSLRISYTGSFTYLNVVNCYERDLAGNLLWQAPNNGLVSGDTVEYYHHDFQKLANGNYMASSYKTLTEANPFNPKNNWTARYNTLIEYNNQKNIVWQWNEKDYVDSTLIIENGDATTQEYSGTHLNGFDIDTAKRNIITSYRNTSRLLNITYPSGQVNYELGRQNTNKVKVSSQYYTLNAQHGPTFLPNGNVLVYDNNYNAKAKIVTNKNTNPIIRVLQPPTNTAPDIQLWQYECKSDTFAYGQQGKEGYTMLMPNGNILVSQGGTHRMFELSWNKKIVWECFSYQYSTNQKKWLPQTNYRNYAATSLYPLAFSLQCRYNNARTVIGCRLNNEGTNKQTFIIETYQNKQLIASHTHTLNGGTSVAMPVATATKLTYLVYPQYALELAQQIIY